jgi:hypothetical protein
MTPLGQRADVPGSILLDAIYTVEELKLRLGWSNSTLEAMHCRGLRIRHLGGGGYVIGRDVADFLRTMPKAAEVDEDFTPAPCTPDVPQSVAEYRWQASHGLCSKCNGIAHIVTRDSANPEEVVVLCKDHFEQAGGAS